MAISTMSKENVKYLLNRTISFLDSLKLIYETEAQDHSGNNKICGFSSHKTMAQQLTLLAADVRQEFSDANFYVYDTSKMLNQFNSVYSYRKDVFDGVFVEVGKIKAFLESKLGQQDEEVLRITELVSQRLRPIIRDVPKNEKEVQDKIEDLLIGKGYDRGTDFDRETGRVKTGLKESVPDFAFASLDFCIEVKLVKDSGGSKKITEEINADITSYKTRYKEIFFVIYDSGGFIQNTDAFKYNIAAKNIHLEITKH